MMFCKREKIYNEYLVWAKNPASGIVLSTRSASATGITMILPYFDKWVFNASTQGYTSDDQNVLVTGSKTINIPLKNLVQSKVSNTVVKPSLGGVVSNGGLGIKLIIPAYALGSSNNDNSVTIYSSAAITETSSFKSVSSVRNVTVNDSRGNTVAILNKPVEVALDYSNDYNTWTAEQRDSMVPYLQLAYWDTAVEDWVVIPATNDSVTHTIRGYSYNPGKFTVVYPQVLALDLKTVSANASYVSPQGAVEDATLENVIEDANTTGRLSLLAASSGKVLALRPDQVDRMLSTSKPLVIKISDITFNLNVSALKVDGLRKTATHIALGAQKVTLAETRELSAKVTNGKKYSIMGDVYSLTARSLMNNDTYEDIRMFNGLVRIGMPVTDTARDAAINGKLLAGRYNDKTKAWEVVTGSYNSTAGMYQFDTDVFSYWVLMVEK